MSRIFVGILMGLALVSTGPAMAEKSSDLELSGYLRLGATTIYQSAFWFGVGASETDTRNPLVGRNDGFMMVMRA